MVDDKQWRLASSEVRVPRRFSTSYKLSILAEIDAASEKGQVGQILRREGLYSSLIAQWRRQREQGAFEAMSAKKRGPKTDKLQAENRRLREANARLAERLDTAEELITAQGNAFALLQEMSRKGDDSK